MGDVEQGSGDRDDKIVKGRDSVSVKMGRERGGVYPFPTDRRSEQAL